MQQPEHHVYPDSVLYKWVHKAMSGATAYPELNNHKYLTSFIYEPQRDSDIRLLYDQLYDLCFLMLANPGDNQPSPVPFSVADKTLVHEEMKLQAVYEKLRWRSEIPETIFNQKEEEIKLWIRERAARQLMHCYFNAAIGQTQREQGRKWWSQHRYTPGKNVWEIKEDASNPFHKDKSSE